MFTFRKVPEIKTREVESLYKKGYKMIDVRRGDEFSGELGHIKGSELITLETELKSALSKMDKNQKIIFVCRSGNRSGKATSLAIKMGFKSVFNMSGGMLQWNKDGLEVER